MSTWRFSLLALRPSNSDLNVQCKLCHAHDRHLLARVPYYVVDALMTFDLAAPMKFTATLNHFSKIVRVVAAPTAHDITMVFLSRAGRVADAISGSRDSKFRISITECLRVI